MEEQRNKKDCVTCRYGVHCDVDEFPCSHCSKNGCHVVVKNRWQPKEVKGVNKE